MVANVGPRHQKLVDEIVNRPDPLQHVVQVLAQTGLKFVVAVGGVQGWKVFAGRVTPNDRLQASALILNGVIRDTAPKAPQESGSNNDDGDETGNGVIEKP